MAQREITMLVCAQNAFIHMIQYASPLLFKILNICELHEFPYMKTCVSSKNCIRLYLWLIENYLWLFLWLLEI